MFYQDYLDGFSRDKNNFPTTHNRNTPLHTDPHYTDKRFDKKEQTVFGKSPNSPYGHKHLSYVYSDRLWQWDYDKMKQSVDMANKSGHQLRSCHWYEVMLSEYLGKSVEIEHIVAGVNWSSGYSYYVLGYREQ